VDLLTPFRKLLGRNATPSRRLTYFLVRTGEYSEVRGQLTYIGRIQAQRAAEDIRERANGQPVAVLTPEGYASGNANYQETTEIIAQSLDTKSTTGLYSLALALIGPSLRDTGAAPHDYVLSGIHDAAGDDADPSDLYVALVMNGSVIMEALRTYPGPLASSTVTDPPPYGSVQQLVTTYDSRDITDRRFI